MICETSSSRFVVTRVMRRDVTNKQARAKIKKILRKIEKNS